MPKSALREPVTSANHGASDAEARSFWLRPQLVQKQVLVLSQVFYPDTQSTSQLLTDLLRNIKAPGLQVVVVTGFRKVSEGPHPPKLELWDGVEIRRTGIAVDFKRNLFLRLLHYFAFLAGASLHLWRLRSDCLVVGVSNPPFTPVLLWILSKVFVKRYQLLLHDIYPDGLIAVGRLAEKSLVSRLWRACNRKAFRSADRLLVLGRDMSRLLESVYGVDPVKIECVPNWSLVSPTTFRKPEETTLYTKLGLAGKFIVQYSGNMGLWHDLNSIVQVAATLNRHSNIHFLMIGDGIGRTDAKAMAEKLQLTNITWLPFQPAEQLEDSLCCCHAALISQRAGLRGVAVPCKLYGILGSGRPVLALVPPGSEIDLVVREEHCGRSFDPSDLKGIAAAILELEGNPNLWMDMCRNAQAACLQKYTVATAANRILGIWQVPQNGR